MTNNSGISMMMYSITALYSAVSGYSAAHPHRDLKPKTDLALCYHKLCTLH
jgi:hypothetical protein